MRHWFVRAGEMGNKPACTENKLEICDVGLQRAWQWPGIVVFITQPVNRVKKGLFTLVWEERWQLFTSSVACTKPYRACCAQQKLQGNPGIRDGSWLPSGGEIKHWNVSWTPRLGYRPCSSAWPLSPHRGFQRLLCGRRRQRWGCGERGRSAAMNAGSGRGR